MKRTLFFIMSVFFVCQSACGAVEIYAAGRRYVSFKAYQAAQKTTQASAAAVALDSKDKTLQINDAGHRLYVLGVENGMNEALRDFYQRLGGAGPRTFRTISSKELQGAIQRAVMVSKTPKLIIAGPGKLRIMDLSTEGQNITKRTH